MSERVLAEQHISACEGCRLELELVRAIGSQEKPPAVGQEDWTIDRIFGPEGGAGAGTQAPAPPPASAVPFAPSAPFTSEEPFEPPAPAAAAKSIFPGMDSEPTPSLTPAPVPVPDAAAPRPDEDAAAKPAGDAPSWDFEPADAKSHVKPPEESLFFAAEALTRRKDQGGKSSNLRVILWGAGGLVGAALLAFSAWFVLHMGSPRTGSTGIESHATPTTDGAAPSAPGQTPDPGSAQPPANGDGAPPAPDAPAPSAPDPNMTSHEAPAPSTPRLSASSTAPPPLPLESPAATPQTVSPRLPRTTAHAPSQPAPAESHGRAASPVTQTPRPAPVSPPDEARDSHSDDAQPEAQAPPPRETPTPEPSVVKTPAQTTPSPTTSRRTPSMWRTETPKIPQAEKPEEAPAQQPTVEASSPIERLHLATVAAEGRNDLDGLRRLRATWKSFMVKIIGPDRARAKREYADCLWAIQNITGRRSDQKDAMAAYREYLLGAPAGGADSRSVSRLRQLEDAISEHR